MNEKLKINLSKIEKNEEDIADPLKLTKNAMLSPRQKGKDSSTEILHFIEKNENYKHLTSNNNKILLDKTEDTFLQESQNEVLISPRLKSSSTIYMSPQKN
jgi:hypothetical protein